MTGVISDFFCVYFLLMLLQADLDIETMPLGNSRETWQTLHYYYF